MVTVMGPMRRYPLGLRAWVFWVLVVLVLSLPGAIPYVGPLIFIAGVAVVFFWFQKLPREPDRRMRPYSPVPLVGHRAVTLAPGQEVVGESNYVVGIGDAVARGGRVLDAVIWWEPKNPFDGSALRVDLLVDGITFTCGYLPRDVARSVVAEVKANADRGLSSIVTAKVYGGTLEKPNFGVWLNEPAVRDEVRFR